MIKRTNSKLVVAAFLAAVALAGCGSDSDSEPGSAATPPAAETKEQEPVAEVIPEPKQTPEEQKISKTSKGKWAKEVCAAIAESTQPVTPPNITQNDPASIKASMEEFFGSVSRQLGGQRQALKDLDAPPAGGASVNAWNAAIDELADTKRQIDAIRKDLAETNVKSSTDVTNMMGAIGKQMQDITNYEGVVATLLNDDGIQKALLAEPDCRKIGGAAVQ